MNIRYPLAVLALSLAVARPAVAADPPSVDAVIASSWKGLTPELQARVVPDAAMLACSASRNDPSKEVAARIEAEARASIVYPASGALMGDWKAGERGALNGAGFRMGDDPKREAGGNCYACHQMAPAEISYGTLGPPLVGYGKIKGVTPQAQRETYDKIYNASVLLACSNMPRFGHNKVLTPEQITNYVAFLLDPESPVNK
jgi:L-cysteine S-thiosulfotransferase